MPLAEVYRCTGRRPNSILLYVSALGAFCVLFFLLTRAIQLSRQTILLWLITGASLLYLVSLRSRPSMDYVITSDAISAYLHGRRRALWMIERADIISARIERNAIHIHIPKKTYVVYTGSTSFIFLEKMKPVNILDASAHENE